MTLKKKEKIIKLSPFPSPHSFMRRNFVTRSSNVFSSNRTRKRRKINKRRHQFLYKRQRCFAESPQRRELRIKHSIEQSIRSHINRLADYRHNSMMKCDSLPCLQISSSPFYCINPCASSFCSTKSSIYGHNISSHQGIARRPVLTRKRQKKNKEQVIRTEELDQDDSEGCSFDSEIKKITLSVQNFEKVRKEFLSGLEKVHAQVSNLRLPTTDRLDVSKQSFPSINRIKSSITSQSKRTNSNNKSKKKSRPVNLKNSEQEPKIVNENVIDNFSKMLLNTSQRPKAKAIANIPTTLQKAIGIGGIGGGNQRNAGLMNLAQAFCSMTSGFS